MQIGKVRHRASDFIKFEILNFDGKEELFIVKPTSPRPDSPTAYVTNHVTMFSSSSMMTGPETVETWRDRIGRCWTRVK